MLSMAHRRACSSLTCNESDLVSVTSVATDSSFARQEKLWVTERDCLEAYLPDKALLQLHAAQVGVEEHERPPQGKTFSASQESIQQKAFQFLRVPHAPDLFHSL